MQVICIIIDECDDAAEQGSARGRVFLKEGFYRPIEVDLAHAKTLGLF